MLAEVAQRHGRSRDKLIGWLKNHPTALSALPRSAEIAKRITRLRPTVLPVAMDLVSQAMTIVQNNQLLFNDAMIVATMRQHDIEHIATNDDDFDRVPELRIWKPR